MNRMTLKGKLASFLLMIAYFTAGYLIINWISVSRSSFFDVSVPLDHALPFLPIFIFGYLLVYLSVLLTYLFVDDARDWWRAVVTFFLVTTSSYVIFLAVPVRMEMRPDMAGVAGVSAFVTQLYYLIDLPYNCFPSLHVAYPTLATFVAWRNHRVLRWILLAMAVIVATSVVLVKQHYIADVVAGFLNAGICFLIAVKSESAWMRRVGIRPSSA